MALDIGYVSAVGAGAISFLSPCVLPLVPTYLCYMAGVSVDDFRGDAGVVAKAGARGALIAASLAFVLGFSTVFVALGAGASTIGRLLRVWQEPLAMAAGVLIIAMGSTSSVFSKSRSCRGKRVSKARASRQAPLPPMSWGWRSPSAGRPASARCWGLS